MDSSYDDRAIIGCNATDVSVPSYFTLFADERSARYRDKHNIPDTFDPDLHMVVDDFALKNSRDVNKICSDLYSALRLKPWTIMGTAIIAHCTLQQFWIMYNHIPIHLASEPRIEDKYKRIILSRDVAAYDEVLNDLDQYF